MQIMMEAARAQALCLKSNVPLSVAMLQEAHECGVLRRDKKAYLKAFFVQVAILSNHQNGRDTHVRQVKAFGPRYEATQFQGGQLHFNTPEFASYSGIR